MFFKTNKKTSYDSLNTHKLYHAIIEQARQPVFYQEWDIPDTIDGRFEMLVLHMFFILQKLHNIDHPEAEAFAQDLFDVMFIDMDRSLREQGVGDLGVPKHIKRMTKAFYGRIFAYEEALENNNLAQALKRNIYNNSNIDENRLAAITAYTKQQFQTVKTQSIDDLFVGTVSWVKI